MSSRSLTPLRFPLDSVESTSPSDAHSSVLPVWLNPKLHTSILSMLASCALHSSQVFGLSQQAAVYHTLWTTAKKLCVLVLDYCSDIAV